MRKSVPDNVVRDLLSIPPFIHRSTRRKVIKKVFERNGVVLSPPHFEVMRTLEENGTMHMAAIGEKLQMPKPQMTILMDRLVSLEVVERQADAADRRIINIVLTDKGRKMVAEHDRLVKDSIKEKLSGLTREELQELSVSLRNLRDILLKLQ